MRLWWLRAIRAIRGLRGVARGRGGGLYEVIRWGVRGLKGTIVSGGPQGDRFYIEL